LFSRQIALKESTFCFFRSEKVPFASTEPLSQKQFVFRCYQNCFIALMVQVRSGDDSLPTGGTFSLIEAVLR